MFLVNLSYQQLSVVDEVLDLLDSLHRLWVVSDDRLVYELDFSSVFSLDSLALLQDTVRPRSLVDRSVADLSDLYLVLVLSVLYYRFEDRYLL